MSQTGFRVGVSRDLITALRRGLGSFGLDLLEDASGVEWEFLARDTDELDAHAVTGYDALFVERPRVTRATLSDSERLLIVARFGVGYDNVDVAACSAAGAMLTIAPDGVRRPVAVSALTLVLALSQNMLVLDGLTRAGRWDDREHHLGVGLVDRTVGVVGLGNIGEELCRLLAPFDARLIAHDPYVTPHTAAASGAHLVDLEDLLRSSDFVVVCCPLTEETHHMIDAQALSAMKRSAFLVNVARGAIVDQPALEAALRSHAIRGAGLDVFEQEPVASNDPILTLDNVIVSPHALCATDQCLQECGRSACRSILEVAVGRIPPFVVNRDVLAHEGLRARLQSLGGSGA